MYVGMLCGASMYVHMYVGMLCVHMYVGVLYTDAHEDER